MRRSIVLLVSPVGATSVLVAACTGGNGSNGNADQTQQLDPSMRTCGTTDDCAIVTFELSSTAT
jgi:hypothetical protein